MLRKKPLYLDYKKLLDCHQWKMKRKKILSRDNNTCRNCGETSQLNVHHKQYHKSTKTGLHVKPWAYASKYLITLCVTCHTIGHKQYQIPTFNI